jgi:hypothetical protein
MTAYLKRWIIWVGTVTCLLIIFGYGRWPLFLRKDNSPRYPDLYFNQERAADLNILSQELLALGRVSSFRVHPLLGPFRTTRLKGTATTSEEDHIKQVLVRHNFHEVRVFPEHSTVRYGYYAGRTWYYYFWGMGKEHVIVKCLPDSIRALTNEWSFGRW